MVCDFSRSAIVAVCIVLVMVEKCY